MRGRVGYDSYLLLCVYVCVLRISPPILYRSYLSNILTYDINNIIFIPSSHNYSRIPFHALSYCYFSCLCFMKINIIIKRTKRKVPFKAQNFIVYLLKKLIRIRFVDSLRQVFIV